MKRDRVRGGVIRGREGKPKRDKKRKREKRADQTEAARDSVRTETATARVVDRTEVGSIFPEDIARGEDPDRARVEESWPGTWRYTWGAPCGI